MLIKHKTLLSLLMVAIAMLSISQLFGSSKDNSQHPYMPRQINLSGNFVSFSIPENFSKDMPADDLIESLNIEDDKLFLKNNSITLLRRLWDFNDDSFFSKNVGTMMMTIHAYKIKKPSEDISHPLGFVNVLLAEMERRDKEENKGKSDSDKVFFPESYQSFFERTHNNQKWFKGGAADTHETQLAFHEWKQISSDTYIGVEFHFAPNNNISMRTFVDTYCREMMNEIMSTFDVIYSNYIVLSNI